MTHELIVGTSEPQDFAIREDGDTFDGTDFSVAIEFRQEGLTAAQIAGTSQVVANWLTQNEGKVRVTGIENLPLGNYYVRFVITDGAGKDGYAPNEASADRWRVVKV